MFSRLQDFKSLTIYRVLQNVTECYIVLQSVTECYREFLAHLLGPFFGLVLIGAGSLFCKSDFNGAVQAQWQKGKLGNIVLGGYNI